MLPSGVQAPRGGTHTSGGDSATGESWKASLNIPKKDERVKTEVRGSEAANQCAAWCTIA
jgi:hypothetical protein